MNLHNEKAAEIAKIHGGFEKFIQLKCLNGVISLSLFPLLLCITSCSFRLITIMGEKYVSID